jgi:dihydrolipoamide dehydrogenase
MYMEKNMAEEIHVDLAVLGGGPGGYTAAFRAADLGLSVCLIEERPALGGVCLHVGCIPSKALLHCAAVVEEAEKAESFGLKFEPPRIDAKALRDKIDGIVRQLAGGLDRLWQVRKISRLVGRGVFRNANTLGVSGEDGEKEVLFRDVIIATGSRPAPLPDSPEDDRLWDSRDALALPFVPERLLIVGGGIIGLEMAQVYSALGAGITLVEMRDQILPPADKDLVQPLLQKLKKKYRIFTGTPVSEISARESGLRVTFGQGDKEETEEFDAVLVAIGRKPNTGDIGLDAVGLEVDEHGFLPVDERLRTSLDHFYAIGDVTGEPMLAHKASHQGKVAAEVVAGRKAAFTPMTIPAVAYTSPEVAWMGLTEKAAGEEGIEFDRGKFPWGASGRALSAGAAGGVTKVLFERKTGRIIGAGICGENAGELIQETVLALEMGADAVDISRTVHAHPTLAETFARAAEVVDGSITELLPGKK